MGEASAYIVITLVGGSGVVCLLSHDVRRVGGFFHMLFPLDELSEGAQFQCLCTYMYT